MRVATRDALTALIDLVSSNLIQLTTISSQLDEYIIKNPNIIDIKNDMGLVEKLEVTVDLRLKIVELLSSARKYIVDAIEKKENEDLIRKLGTLAQYYVYAGVRIDKRVAEKFRGFIAIENLEESIDTLYESFEDLLKLMGVKIV